jgi:hypothetical protein
MDPPIRLVEGNDFIEPLNYLRNNRHPAPLVLTDYHSIWQNGPLEFICAARADLPWAHIYVGLPEDDPVAALQAFRAGATGIVLWNTIPRDFDVLLGKRQPAPGVRSVQINPQFHFHLAA